MTLGAGIGVFLSGIGLTADAIDIASYVWSKIKKDTACYNDFNDVITKIVKFGCDDYCNLLKKEHSNIKLTDSYKSRICIVVTDALDHDEEFTWDMLPDNDSLSQDEKQRLFRAINMQLHRSLGSLICDAKNKKKFAEIKTCLSELAHSMNRLETFLADAKQTYVQYKIVTVDVAQRPTDKYITRLEEQKIKDKLNASHKILLVSGIGGIGKSEICKVLFYQYIESLKPQYVGWLQFNKNFKDTLNLKFKMIENTDDKDENIRKIKLYINELTDKLLLFVDNVDIIEPVDIELFTSLPCNLIMTSRLRDMTDRMTQIMIGTLSKEECVELYQKHHLNPKDAVCDIEKIVIKAAYHTLAVELLAKTAKATRGLSASELLGRIEKSGFCLENIEAVYMDGKRGTFIEHFSKIFALVNLEPEEIIVLKKFSLMPYQPLHSVFARKWFELKNFDVINSLITKGWIMESDGDFFMMHPIIAEVVRHKHPLLYSECGNMISIMASDAHIEEKETFIDKLGILPFVSNVAEYFNGSAKKVQCAEQGYEYLIDLNLAIGRIYKDNSDYVTALEFHENGLAIGKNTLPKTDTRIARAHTWMGIVHYKQKNYDSAKQCYDLAIKICDESQSMDVQDKATYINHVGLNFFALYDIDGNQENLDKAFEYIHESYTIRCKLGETHQHTLYALGNLARIHRKRGNHDLALETLDKVLKGMLINSGNEQNIDTVRTMALIADVYDAMGDSKAKTSSNDEALVQYKRAFDTYTQVLETRQKLFRNKPYHIDIGKTLYRMGEICAKMHDYPRAISLLKEAQPIYEKNGVKNDINEKIKKYTDKLSEA